MIGNDVIDLQLAFQNERWKSPRFQNKLFSSDEKTAILNSDSPQLMLWIFWSMKESAYKANQRRFNLERKYNPKSFACILNEFNKGQAKGTVTVGEHIYKCSSFIDSKKIHSISYTEETTTFNLNITENKATVMKDEFFHKISISRNLEKENLKLESNEHRIPQLYVASKKIDIPFSFSHHGRFSAYVFGMENKSTLQFS